MNKKTSSIDTIAKTCIAVRMRMLNRLVTNVYDEALRPLGLKVSQMNIMVAAAKMGVARPTDVCQHLQLDVSTLSRNVERMKARGWLKTIPMEDGRAQPFQLTDAGKRLVERAIPAWETAQHQVTTTLGKNVIEALDTAIHRMG